MDRLPPHSPEAEQGVLGCVLLCPNDCMGNASRSSRAGAEVFYDLRHQTIFSMLVEMYDSREAIDVITLQQRLKDKQLLEQVGGIAYLSALPDTVPSAANLELLPGHRAGEVPAAEDDPDLHRGGRPGLRLRRRSGCAAWTRWSATSCASANRGCRARRITIKDLVKKAINTIEDFHQRQGMLTGVGTGFHGPGQDDQRAARRAKWS